MSNSIPSLTWLLATLLLSVSVTGDVFPQVQHELKSEWGANQKTRSLRAIPAGSKNAKGEDTIIRILDVTLTSPSDEYLQPGEILAAATFQPVLKETGWDHLHVKTGKCTQQANSNAAASPGMSMSADTAGTNTMSIFAHSDISRAYAAGWIEGFLTFKQIWYFSYNTAEESGVLKDPKRAKQVLETIISQDTASGDCEALVGTAKDYLNRKADSGAKNTFSFEAHEKRLLEIYQCQYNIHYVFNIFCSILPIG